jgi:hypothetical protein
LYHDDIWLQQCSFPRPSNYTPPLSLTESQISFFFYF